MLLTYIKWWDACSEPTIEWTDLSALECGLEKCESVGWIVDESDQHIALAQNIHRDLGQPEDPDGDPRIAGVIVIPKALVIVQVTLGLTMPTNLSVEGGEGTPAAGLPIRQQAGAALEAHLDGEVNRLVMNHLGADPEERANG